MSLVDTIITPNSPTNAAVDESADLMAFNPASSYTRNAAEADIASSLDGASDTTIAIDIAPSDAIEDIPSLDISPASDKFTAEAAADDTVVHDEKDKVVPPTLHHRAAGNSSPEAEDDDAMMLENAMRQVITTIPTVVSRDDSAAAVDEMTILHPVAAMLKGIDHPEAKVASNNAAATSQAPAPSETTPNDTNSTDQSSTVSTQRKKNEQLKMPEKPKTAFLHYAAYASGFFKTRYPHVTGTELTRAITRGWIEMIPEGCIYWGNFAAADGIRYQNQLAEYCETLQARRREGEGTATSISAALTAHENDRPNSTEKISASADQGQGVNAAPQQINSAPTSSSKKKRKAEQNTPKAKAPKKNKTAYMHYSIYARNFMKSKHPHVTGADATQAVRDGWNAMADHHQKFWKDRAAADKIRYEEELERYNNQVETVQGDSDEDVHVV